MTTGFKDKFFDHSTRLTLAVHASTDCMDCHSWSNGSRRLRDCRGCHSDVQKPGRSVAIVAISRHGFYGPTPQV